MTMDHMNHNHIASTGTHMLSQPIPIPHLPLRRSTAALLRGCGFHTIKDVYDIVESQQGRDTGIDIMSLVVEFRQYRRNGNTMIQENYGSGTRIDNINDSIITNPNCAVTTTTTTTTSATDEEIKYASNVYQELIDAVTIVTQDDITMTTTVFDRSDNGIRSTAKTAADLLRLHHDVIGNSATNTIIITFCRELDELLDGGIAIGELTELAGSPGSGKTTMCLQLAVNAALPYYCGGVQGRTIYIDTEGSFAPERCYDLAAQLIQHVQTGLRRKHRQKSGSNGTSATTNSVAVHEHHQWNITAEEILNNILVYRAYDVADLSAIIHGAIPALLSSQNKQDVPIRLIVVDSIAFPFRASASTTAFNRQSPSTSLTTMSSSVTSMDYATRIQQLTATAATLSSLSVQYQLAVVAVNQMTTKFTATITDDNDDAVILINENDQKNGDTENSSNSTAVKQQHRTQLIPALGESWSHAVTSRLILNKLHYSNHQEHHQYRTCSLTKSPRLATGDANLVITKAGIRGIDYLEATTKRSRS